MSYKQSFGKWGEEKAALHLTEQGFRIVCRNWRCKFGEIDIVALKDDEIVFVEVKTRKDKQYGFPEEAITAEKRRHLIESAMAYVEQQQSKQNWRIDIIAIRQIEGQNTELEWFQDAIREE